MKNSSAIRRLRFLGSGVELRRDRVTIRLPHPRLVRLAARSVFLAVAIMALPWILRSAHAAGEIGVLLNDLQDRGFYGPEGKNVFIGTALNEIHAGSLSDDEMSAVADATVDFAYAGGGRRFRSFDRALKVGGVAAFELGSDPSELLCVPSNYQMVYARQFESTVVVVTKTEEISAKSTNACNLLLRKKTTSQRMPMARRLLAIPETTKEALNGLEDVLLEPPTRRLSSRRTRYLPELTGDSLDGYPRRVFVDVGPPGRVGSTTWFERHYPRRHNDFEMIRVDVVADGGAASSSSGGMSEWLAGNVRENDYVVVKAEAEVVEEMVKGRALGLVDELFLECKHQWEKRKGNGVRSRRAYWECLALYGKLRDEGVAVHQWWG